MGRLELPLPPCSPNAAATFKLPSYLGSTRLNVTVREVLRRVVQSESGLQSGHVRFPAFLMRQPQLRHDPLTVLLGEQQGDAFDLGEEVEVRCQRGDGAVQEDHVLDEQHQLL